MQRRSCALIDCASHSARLLAALLLIVVVDLNTIASAQTWTGAASTDWTDPTNWSGGAVPTTGTVTINTELPNSTVLGVSGAAIGTSGILQIGDAVATFGSLSIQNGSTLTTNGYARIGQLNSGDAAVTGVGSTWTINHALGLIVGTYGAGSLTISDGGSVSVIGGGYTIVGHRAGSNGILNVTNGGRLTTSGDGYVGGGSMSEFDETGTGIATVTGAGSQWAISGEEIVGGAGIGGGGTGTLNITNGGLVVAQGGVTVAKFSGSIGTVNIVGGTLQTRSLAVGLGTAQVNFDGGTLRAIANGPSFITGFSGTELNIAAGGLTVDTAGYAVGTDTTSAFSGVGGLTTSGIGTMILAADNTYTGPTTITQGTLLVNGSIVSLTTVEAAGTLGGTGTINNDVTSAGTVSPGDGGIGQKLTIAGNYAGNGGTLAIQTVLGDDASLTNQLVITDAGHTASGTTGVVVTNYQGQGAGALTTGDGIPIIVAENGATTDSGAFSLAERAAAGPFEYLLFKGTPDGGGGAGAENSWYLRSHMDNPLLPPGEPVPLYRPEVPLYSAMGALARQQQQTTLGTFHDRYGDQRLAAGAGNRTAAWGRLFGEHLEQSSSGIANASFDGDTGGLQSGLDVMQWVSPSGHQDRYGIFAAYARSTGDVRGFALGVENLVAGRLELDGTSVGAYWTHLAPSGWYTDAVLMGSRFNADGHSMGNEVNVTGYGLTASIEGGYPIVLGGGLRLEPQAQLVYSHINLDHVDDIYSDVAFDTPDALSGRIGVRLSADLATLPLVLRPYLKANIWQHFTETDTIRFSGVHEIRSRHEATTLELGGGLVAQLSSDVGLWFNADYTTDVGSSDDSREAVRGTAGLRMVW